MLQLGDRLVLDGVFGLGRLPAFRNLPLDGIQTRPCDVREGPRNPEGSFRPCRFDGNRPLGGSASAPPVTDQASILKAMAKAYQGAKSYRDKGSIRIRGTEAGQPVDQTVDFSLAFERPNKLRLTAYRGAAVCDGKQFWTYARHLPDQVARRPAPPQMTVQAMFEDEVLMDAISQGPTLGISLVPVQLLLLLTDDPLKTLLFESQEPELLPVEKIGDRECFRIRITRRDGKAVFWIDRATFVLRRFELPLDEINRGAKEENAEVQSLVAEFEDAALDAPVNAEAFQFAAPANSQLVDYLTMPTVLLLGKPAPAFAFTGMDGAKLDPASLKGKVTVLDFWATHCGPCRIGLPMLNKLAEKYKDNDKVAFRAVSVDDAKIPDDDLKKMFTELNVSLPIARDPQGDANRKLALTMIPAMCLIDAKGIVQDYQVGLMQNFESELARKLEALLAGRDVFQEPTKVIAEDRQKYKAVLDKWVARGILLGPIAELPETNIAAKTEPKTLKLRSLWKADGLKSPGNLLVVPQANGDSRLFAIDQWRSVVEIAADGKVAARHELQIGEQEVVTFLRTATNASGKRYFAVSGVTQQRVHLFDENWKLLFHYPEGADNPSQRHAGISDAQLGDLDGDGNPELVVGYFGDVGVHAVSLEGKRLWTYRTSIAEVVRVALLAPDEKGRRSILCDANNAAYFGTLMAIDSEGKTATPIEVPGRQFVWVAAEDLDGDQKPELCALHIVDLSTRIAVGVRPGGGELWNYELPKGAFERSPEQVVAARLSAEGPGQWLLPGPDGSIHVLAADGKPLDQFAYGASLSGLATARFGGKQVLVVSTVGGLEALEIEAASPAK